MKIGLVYFHFWPNIGGTEMVMLDYGRALASLGHEVTVYTTNAVKFRPVQLPDLETKDGVSIRRFRFISFPMRYAFISRGLVRALLRSQEDVVQVFSILPCFFTLSAILIARLRSIPIVLYPQFGRDRFQHDRRLLVRIAGKVFDLGVAIHVARTVQYTIAITKCEERYFRANGIDAVKTIYESVPRKEYPSTETLNEFRLRFGIRKEDRIGLLVGRIDRRKGLDILVKALPAVLREVPNTRILVVGEDWGALQESLKLARSLSCLDRLTLTGTLSEQDLSAAYVLCHLVVVPSYFEAFGRTVVEARRFGKPVVVSDGVALSELVTPQTGIVVKRRSPNALAEAMIRVLRDCEWTRKHSTADSEHLNSAILEPREVASLLAEIYSSISRTGPPEAHLGFEGDRRILRIETLAKG